MKYESESVTIEYKKAADNVPKEFWNTYSAFANTQGGKIVLGVEEVRRGEFVTYGVNDVDKTIKTIFDTVQSDKVNINLLTEESIKVIDAEDGKKIIEVAIPEASYMIKPVYLNGQLNNSFLRRGEGDYRCTPQELRDLIRNTKDILDDEPLEGYGIEDIDMETLKNYRTRLEHIQPANHYSDKSNTEFLISVGAMKKNRKNANLELTLGGLLFFGKYASIRDEIPHFHLEFLNRINNGEERWSDRIATGDLKYPNLNLYNFFIETLQKLRLSVKSSFELDEDLSRKSNDEVEVALREALANAIIHADYRMTLPVKISIFSDYYEFENPGHMRVSIEEFVFGWKSLPRNHVLELLFRLIGFCERSGSGGQKIFQTAVNRQYKLPDLETTHESTLLRFWNVNLVDSFSDYDDDKKEILTILKKDGACKAKELEEATGFKKYKVNAILNSLIAEEVVSKHGKGKNTFYTIAESAHERIASLEHLIRQIQKDLKTK